MGHSDSFQKRVANTIRGHQMLEDGQKILVGVSGGADSVCLLRILAASPSLGKRTLKVAHVNHGWRGESSDEDERFVRQLSADLGLEVFVHLSTEADTQTGTGPEAGARQERWNFFDAVAKREAVDRIAIAHNREDRAETFFLNLMRGGGSDGLASMRPVSGNVIRPLINVGRTEIQTWLDQIGQSWRKDDSNFDTRFARNRVRHDIFPILQKEFNPRLIEALTRTIDILENEGEWMEKSVTDWLAAHVSYDGTDMVLQVHDLTTEPVAFVRRILRGALRMAGSPMRDIGFDHIEQLRAVLRPEKSGRVIELPGSTGVERSFDTLRFFVEDRPASDYEYELPIPGQIEVPEIGARFQARLVQPDAQEMDKPNGDRVFVDGESLGRYVKIRNWRSGDFYYPDGLSASKLKTLFQKRSIPLRKRRQWPVVVADSSIVWVASFPVSRDFVPTGRSRRVVELEASHILR